MKPTSIDTENAVKAGLAKAITAMSESLVAWRNARPGERGPSRDACLITGREAYRQMAYRLLATQHGAERARDIAQDIAQERAGKLSERERSGHSPFDKVTFDALQAKADRLGKPRSGEGSPLNGYLYRALQFGVCDEIDKLKKSWAMLPLDSDERIETALRSDRLDGNRRMSVREAIAKAVEIHDDYLDTQTFRKRSLREALGTWTPMQEWTGHRAPNERPKGIPKRTLVRHIGEIRLLVRAVTGPSF